MASKSIAISGCDLPQLSWSRVSLFKPLNWIGSLNTARRDVWFGAIRAEVSQFVDRTVTNVSGKLQKDFSSFPRPLTVADFSADPDDGMKVRISYKGLPGSYSEDAALKAYPKCETVPCDEFEEAFKAVELWLADKAVLPIECSIAGSIHRNYDLLLRHRLHIVGEVQLSVKLCLLAMPGVRTEHLKRVLSHPQVLDMSDIFLSKLSVARESVDDAAGAAQYIASNELRDAGAVASSRASEIYGLNILAENIQNFFLTQGNRVTSLATKVSIFPYAKCSHNQGGKSKPNIRANESRKNVKKDGKGRHHLWKKRDPARSGVKALNLVRIISELPNEKEAVYGALDKWAAWETEFPLLAAAKALRILRENSQWLRVIQVAKWMLSKGQGTTMGTYDTLLLAFDKDNRIDEAESLWNMILHTHTRSISKRLFSRMISLYDHHNMPDELIEVFADMEELGVRPDEDTIRRVTHAFKILGQEDKQKMVVKKHLSRWKYIHFKGERIRVRRDI